MSSFTSPMAAGMGGVYGGERVSATAPRGMMEGMISAMPTMGGGGGGPAGGEGGRRP